MHQLYDHLRAFESDYDRAQGSVRATASLWTLAAFAGFSYAFSQHNDHSQHIDLGPFLGVAISWAAAFGLFILWISDQLVYQKLLHSVFLHGMYLEWRDQTLPPIRTKMYSDNLNVPIKLSTQYLVPMFAFFLVELYFAFGVGRFVIPGQDPTSGLSAIILGVLLLSHIVVVLFALCSSMRDRDLLKEHGNLYPPAFKTYIGKKEYGVQLEKQFSIAP